MLKHQDYKHKIKSQNLSLQKQNNKNEIKHTCIVYNGYNDSGH